MLYAKWGDDPSSGCNIVSVTNGMVSEIGVYIEVTPNTVNLNLAAIVTVSSGASWQLFADMMGQTPIPTKYASNLLNGDNYYYIVVTSSNGNNSRTYGADIYRNHFVEMTYVSCEETFTTEQILTHTTLGIGPEITREGYTFVTWDCEGYYVTEAKTYMAEWEANIYTVTLDVNGGNDLVEDTKELTFDEEYEFAAPERIGHTFIGWYTAAESGTKLTDNEGKSLADWTIASDTTLYAVWSINSYAVTANKNISAAGTVLGGGSKNYTSSVTLTAETNAGYTWLGWYDESDTKVSEGTSLSYTFTMPADNKTYEARWITCPVTLEKNIDEAGTVSGIERTILGASTTITAVSNAGYTWLGWYDESDTKVSEGTSLSYTFTMPADNKTYEARWITCPVTLEKNIDEAGTVSGIERTILGASTTITAVSNAGYTWLGWYDESDTKISEGTSLSYTFTMPAENKTYEARWITCPVTLEKNIDEAGTVSGIERTILGASTTITAVSNAGYTWLGWYDESDTKISEGTSLSYTFTMPSENVTYKAKWGDYNIILTENISAAGTVDGAGKYVAETERTITATTNAGYTWLGWYDESDTKVSASTSLTYTFNMPAEDKTFEARWKANEGTVSFDANGGEGTMTSADISTGDTLPKNAFTKTDYFFVGWALTAEGGIEYFDEGAFIVSENGGNYTLYAVWVDNIPDVVGICGYYREGNYIWFGEYPQTIKANDVTVGTTTDSRGYYLGSDGLYYAKVTATPYSGYKFSNDTTVTSGTEYYFKVEPIKWRILNESGGTALILCESIIANKRYDDSSNNYMNSEIRAWLNNEFYNTAFTALQKELIQITNVDNSVYSTGYDSNPYACANTNDKIFLPSYREMVNSAYGFNSNSSAYDTARRRLTSDYSRATGAYMNTDTSYYYGNGYWWLRSPDNIYSLYALFVYRSGDVVYKYYVYDTIYGVVPALKIQLS